MIYNKDDPRFHCVALHSMSGESHSLGSGFAVRLSDGKVYGLTNAHCVENSLSLRATTFAGRMFRCHVLGVDNESDVALFSLDANDDLKPVNNGDFDVSVLEPVVAIGTPLDMDLRFSVTSGEISDEWRYADSLLPCLQHTAKINPGNSGGPLFNADMEFIGMNVALQVSPYGGSAAYFALRGEEVLRVAEQLLANKAPTRSRLRLQVADCNALLAEALGANTSFGALISKSYGPDSKKLRLDDLVVAVNNHPVRGAADLIFLTERYAENEITYSMWRRGELINVTINPGTFVETPLAQAEFNAFGLHLRQIDELGVLVEHVAVGSPCHAAGISSGHIVTSIRNMETGEYDKLTTLAGFEQLAAAYGDNPFIIHMIDYDGYIAKSVMQRQPQN